MCTHPKFMFLTVSESFKPTDIGNIIIFHLLLVRVHCKGLYSLFLYVHMTVLNCHVHVLLHMWWFCPTYIPLWIMRSTVCDSSELSHAWIILLHNYLLVRVCCKGLYSLLPYVHVTVLNNHVHDLLHMWWLWIVTCMNYIFSFLLMATYIWWKVLHMIVLY